MYEVTAADIRIAAYGVEIPEGQTVDEQLTRLIDKAEARLTVLVPSLPTRIEAGTVPIDLVRGVVEDMVIRVVKNPRSLRTLGLDDFNITLDHATSSGLLHPTADELGMLRPARRRAYGNITTYVPAWRLPRA